MPASAQSWSDEELEISWLSPSKPKYGKCSYAIISITPKRNLLAMTLNVKNSRNDVVGYHGRVILEPPVNQTTNKLITFCNYGQVNFKGPYKWDVMIKYPYTSAERGSERYIQTKFKFKKIKKKR